MNKNIRQEFPNISIGIIGTGNVAWHLAHAFHSAGIRLSGLLVRNVEAARKKRLHLLFPAPLIEHLSDLTERSDILIIAVNDNHIPEIASRLTSFAGIVCHTSGSMPMSILSGHIAGYGVFYPLQTLTKGVALPAADIPVCLEASDPTTLKLLSEISQYVGFQSRVVDSSERLMLHVAAVIVCNFTNHMLTLGRKLTQISAMDFDVLEPLIRETFHKAMEKDPFSSQTGPAIRGDQVTIAKHLDVLESTPDIREIYQIITKSITQTHNPS